MDDIVSVLGEFLTDLTRVFGLVAWDVVAVQDGGQTCNIEREHVELASCGSQGWNARSEEKKKRPHCYC
jgi:hypothetical protein